MYKTYKEITTQFESLQKTVQYFENMHDEVGKFLCNQPHNSITFFGSGSSFSVCKSAETSFKMHSGLNANAFAAGDMMLNFPHYRNVIRDSLLVSLSRSGSTSEVVEIFKKSQGLAANTISICARENSPLSEMAGFNLEIPWAFDESVCQTRTVTNLFASCILLLAGYPGNEAIRYEMENAISEGTALMEKNMSILENYVNATEWNTAVVLADSAISGLGEEAALAFKEICRVPSNYHHILDVRHGPMVLINDKTLVILVCTPFSPGLHKNIVSDLKSRGAKVITTGPTANGLGSDIHIETGTFDNYAVTGIQFMFIPQLVSYYKAVKNGINPDSPEGLNPWIELK